MVNLQVIVYVALVSIVCKTIEQLHLNLMTVE